jgi:hypothetical protein
MQMAIKILEGESKLVHEHLDFFLKGNLSLEKSERRRPYTWFPEAGWQDLMRLCAIDQQRGIKNSPLSTVADSIQRDEIAWKTFYELETPESSPLPDNLSKSLSTFESLLVLRCVRMDRVTVCQLQSISLHLLTSCLQSVSCLQGHSKQSSPMWNTVGRGFPLTLSAFLHIDRLANI